MKYTAINIGPILDTFAMAKKPRELWNASYMFSYLMECIIDKLSDYNIISPAVIDWNEPVFYEAGLYPDRIFIEGEINADEVINAALKKFNETIGVGTEYVNVMSVSTDCNESIGAVKELNRLLDCLELYKRPVSDNGLKSVESLLYGKNNMKLYAYATNRARFSIPSLAEIATHHLKNLNRDNWQKICELLDRKDVVADEDIFYKEIKRQFKEEYKSYYKYICVVQADGDNMGSIVSKLETDKIKKLSKSLLDYGSEACRVIKRYGGFPVYAGGDDLLFIAPVISSSDSHEIRTVFDLLNDIDALYEKVDEEVGNIGRPSDLHTSVSYGLSISYYKYPLYEALKNARELLFDTAKDVDGKNAIAWRLRKHSGSGFEGSFCKGSKACELFSELLKISVDETTVSAIAHKLRANENLLDMIRNKGENRIKAFFNKVMEESPCDDNSYKGITRNLLNALFDQAELVRKKREEASGSKSENKDLETGKILETLYGMLRTAKFINGEGDSDE